MGCARFERTLAEQWPELANRPAMADHVRHCPECSASVRIQARMANLLEGIGPERKPSLELANRVKQIVKKSRSTSNSKHSASWMAVALVLVALMGQWHSPPVESRGFGAASMEKGQTIGMVDARQVTEQGAKVLDRALAVMEPLTLATTSTITRVLYEVTEPILVINRS